VEPDPLRRLRLNISNDRLGLLHPADLADIVEELGSEERESIFETMDSESAAELLSEVDPKMQASILESLEPEVAADIIEEMSPDEAADVLAELEDETSEEILDEMESAPGEEVRELLEYKDNTAGGMMNTEYLSLPHSATIEDAMAALRRNEDLLESLNVLFLVDAQEKLTGAVPLARLFLAGGDTPLLQIASETLISAPVDLNEDRVTELFDKYNLFTLPVIDREGRLAGVVTADDIISVLREK
jgi:Mg/Co/Ni transporter MgtE